MRIATSLQHEKYFRDERRENKEKREKSGAIVMTSMA